MANSIYFIVHQVIREMTGGGADYCFECVGLASLMSEAFKSSRRVIPLLLFDLIAERVNSLYIYGMQGWGKTVILGVEKNFSPFIIDTTDMLDGRSFVGSAFGGVKAKTDIPLLINKYLNKVKITWTHKSL